MKRLAYLALALCVGSVTPACGPGGGGNDVVDPDATTSGDGGGADAMIACDAEFVRMNLDTDMCKGFSAQSCSANGFCPATITQMDPMRPQLAVTQIDMTTPRSLGRTSPVSSLLNNAIGRGAFLWGLDLNFTTMMIRTGALQQGVMPRVGTSFYSETFRFYSGGAPMMLGGGDAGMVITGLAPDRWDPVNMAIMGTPDNWSTATSPLVTVPAYDEATGTLLTELPLRNARFFNVKMNSTRTCIGVTRTTFNSCLGSQWQTTDMAGMPTGGQIEAFLVVDEIRRIPIPSLNTTLCNIVAGRNCEMIPMAMWSNQPDGMVNGMPAWRVQATFTGVALQIMR